MIFLGEAQCTRRDSPQLQQRARVASRAHRPDTAAQTCDHSEPQRHSASSTELGTMLSSASTNPSQDVSDGGVSPCLTTPSTLVVSRSNPVLSHIVPCTQHQDKHTAVSDTPLVSATNHAAYRPPPSLHTHPETATHLQITEQVQHLPSAIVEWEETSPGLSCGDMPGLVEGDGVAVTGASFVHFVPTGQPTLQRGGGQGVAD